MSNAEDKINKEYVTHDSSPSFSSLFLVGCCVSSFDAMWMMIALFILSTFFILIFCLSCVFYRWLYKRRKLRKTELLREKYRLEQKQRREMDLKLLQISLKPTQPQTQQEMQTPVLKTGGDAVQAPLQSAAPPAPAPAQTSAKAPVDVAALNQRILNSLGLQAPPNSKSETIKKPQEVRLDSTQRLEVSQQIPLGSMAAPLVPSEIVGSMAAPLVPQEIPLGSMAAPVAPEPAMPPTTPSLTSNVPVLPIAAPATPTTASAGSEPKSYEGPVAPRVMTSSESNIVKEETSAVTTVTSEGCTRRSEPAKKEIGDSKPADMARATHYIAKKGGKQLTKKVYPGFVLSQNPAETGSGDSSSKTSNRSTNSSDSSTDTSTMTKTPQRGKKRRVKSKQSAEELTITMSDERANRATDQVNRKTDSGTGSTNSRVPGMSGTVSGTVSTDRSSSQTTSPTTATPTTASSSDKSNRLPLPKTARNPDFPFWEGRHSSETTYIKQFSPSSGRYLGTKAFSKEHTTWLPHRADPEKMSSRDGSDSTTTRSSRTPQKALVTKQPSTSTFKAVKRDNNQFTEEDIKTPKMVQNEAPEAQTPKSSQKENQQKQQQQQQQQPFDVYKLRRELERARENDMTNKARDIVDQRAQNNRSSADKPNSSSTAINIPESEVINRNQKRG